MGFFTHKRRSHHAFTTVNVKGMDIDIVVEGIIDIDECSFEPEDVYLKNGRDKIEGMASFRLPKRIENFLRSGIFDEHFAEEAWRQL